MISCVGVLGCWLLVLGRYWLHAANVAVQPFVKSLIESCEHVGGIAVHVGELAPLQDVFGFSRSLNFPDEVLHQDSLRSMGGAKMLPTEFGCLILPVLSPDAHSEGK